MGAVKELQFGDGDDSSVETESVNIKPVANGYVVTLCDDNGDAEYVFTDKKEMMKFVGGVL